MNFTFTTSQTDDTLSCRLQTPLPAFVGFGFLI